jgi:hypothetical protein
MDLIMLKICVEHATAAEKELYLAADEFARRGEDYQVRFKFVDRLEHYLVDSKLLHEELLNVITKMNTPTKKKFYQFWK